MGNILVSCIKGGKCMPFFEGKQDLYQILCFIIIPIIVCTVFYFLKPKKIWVSPIIIMCVFLVTSVIFYPYIFKDILTKNYDFTTIFWFIIVVPIQIVLALFFTFITHFLIKRKSRTKRT
jgi:hypothetical protein